MTPETRLSFTERINTKLFYGWVIVAGAFITIGVIFGVRNSFGIFFKSLEAEFGLPRAATSSVYSIYMLLTAIFAIITGWALDRYGPRLVVGAMGVLTGLSLLVTSQTTSLWYLFLSYSLMLSVGTGGARPVLMSLVSRWFYRRRGLAVGIATSGMGLGTLYMAPLAAYLIAHLEWRMSFAVLGLLTWIIIIPLSMLFRKDPGQIGALPDGVRSIKGENGQFLERVNLQMTGYSLPDALRTRSFWFIATIMFINSIMISLIFTHVVPYATDMGIPDIKASTIVSAMGISHVLFRLLIGRISDVVGRKIPGVVSAAFGAAALFLLMWTQELPMFYLFAVLFGISWGGLGVSIMTIVGDTFGELKLGTIMGTLEIGVALGSAAGATFGGYVYDVTGSYLVAFIVGAAMMVVSSVLYGLIRREVKA